MANPRATVLGVVFSLLLGASILTILREDGVDAPAWALLGLTVAFAAATVIAFFAKEVDIVVHGERAKGPVTHEELDGQILPDPVDTGFDIPVL